VSAASVVRLAKIAADRPPRAFPTNKEFFRFKTTRFISRSLTFLSIGPRRRTEDVQLLPLLEKVVHGLSHGMFGQRLLFP
jgi:hypothetical protein